MGLVPVLAIVAILSAVAFLGFGSGSGANHKQVRQEVSELLAGIPQDGPILGRPGAPITLAIYADLECPTVKLFVENYLPTMVDKWVRTGVVKLEYRSLQTDTANERTFFRQEIATLAAGKQDKMWDFLLTFIHEQGEPRTDYATAGFLLDIASRVPGLRPAQWRSDRENPLLSRQVALDVYSARSRDVRYTPSFALEFSRDARADLRDGVKVTASMRSEFKASLVREVEALRKEGREETLEDVPSLRFQP